MHWKTLFKNKSLWIVAFSTLGIALYFLPTSVLPLSIKTYICIAVMVLGGVPMLVDILKDIFRGEIGADALAIIALITSFILKEYLAGAIIVFMLASGSLLETYAVQRASSVLNALLKRMPRTAHRKTGAQLIDIAVDDIRIDDLLMLMPHEIAPVDAVVIEGHSFMDESYLTGEPFMMSKAPGSEIFSGAINGESALTIRAVRVPKDSRYAKIVDIMRAAEEKRPRIRRLADRLGGIYTPVALVLGGVAWAVSGDPTRFLAVLVVATPCPLIIAIPVAIIGAISLAAKRGIIVKNPSALEQIQLCRTAIFDKTGTLTYGEPALVDEFVKPGFAKDDVLAFAASLEYYSKHPLARAIVEAAKLRQLGPIEVAQISEKSGHGLEGMLHGQKVQVVGRRQVQASGLWPAEDPVESGGLECFVLIDGKLAARYLFRDAPRSESPSFIKHLGPRHAFDRQMIISGDRESEVRYLAEAVGIQEIYAGKSPEEKLVLVRAETAKAKTLYIGDGINDAPAMLAATVGIAIGQNSDVTSEAAGVVVMENSLRLVDEFMHISERMHRIALQSAIGGMLLSVVGMIVAATGHLPPVAGAITQEAIDLLAIVNALRVSFPPKILSDV